MILTFIIQPLSTLWWQGIISTTLIIIGFLFFANKTSKNTQNTLMMFLGAVQIFREIWRQWYLSHLGLWDTADALPLHLCGIASLVSGIIMFYPSQLGFEFLALLGVPGAIHSFLTPELAHGENWIQVVEYYISHGSIILITLYLALFKNFKIREKSWITVFALSQVLIIFISLMNYLLESNYMYLCQRPNAPNPLIIGEWPWYILGFEIVGFIHIFLFYIGIRKIRLLRD